MSRFLNTAHPIVEADGRIKQHFLKYLESLSAITWEDLRFPATAINPPGQASDPARDHITPGWLFAGNRPERLDFVGQLPHTYVQGSAIKPHVHWTKTSAEAGNVYWRLDYAWAPINGVIDSFTTLSATTVVGGTPDTDTADKHLMTSFGEISGAGRTISDMIIMRFFRVGGDALDTYGDDARMLEFDIHYQRHGLSSLSEFSRT